MRRSHFALFDSLRGLAVLCVVGFHVASLTGRLGHGVAGRLAEVLGTESVLVFFGISGFLLYRPFVAARAEGRPPPRTRAFLRRRAFRILPAYWTALTLLAVFPGIVGAFGGEWWRYYGLLQLYWTDSVGRGIPVAWTLCVEAAFYLLLPLWAVGARRLRLGPGWVAPELTVLGVGAGAALTLQVLAARQDIPLTLASSAGQFAWLALGMALAVASVAASRRDTGSESRFVGLVAARSGIVWLVLACSIAAQAALVPPGGLGGFVNAVHTYRSPAETLGRAALSALLVVSFLLPAVFGDGAGGVPRRILALRPVAWVGVVSYSLYLWHLPVAQLLALDADPGHFSAHGLGLAERIHTAPTLILMALTVAVSAAVAAVSFRFVELPFIRWSGGSRTAVRRSGPP